MVGDKKSLEVERERNGQIQEENTTQLGDSLDMEGEGGREPIYI